MIGMRLAARLSAIVLALMHLPAAAQDNRRVIQGTRIEDAPRAKCDRFHEHLIRNANDAKFRAAMIKRRDSCVTREEALAARLNRKSR